MDYEKELERLNELQEKLADRAYKIDEERSTLKLLQKYVKEIIELKEKVRGKRIEIINLQSKLKLATKNRPIMDIVTPTLDGVKGVVVATDGEGNWIVGEMRGSKEDGFICDSGHHQVDEIKYFLPVKVLEP